MRKHQLISVWLILFSCASLSAEPSVKDALKLIQQGQPKSAVNILEPLAAAGNAEAQLQLGILHYNGRGVKENEKTAIFWLTKSANQGNAEAMYQLGNAFTFGNDSSRLVPDADTEAAMWYFKAATAGSVDAQYSLGLLFLAGKGVEKNDQEASFWMQKAAAGGHKDAKGYIGGAKR